VRVGHGEAEVALGEAAPVAGAAVEFERLVGVVAGDGVFVDRAVDAGERGVDVAEEAVGVVALSGLAQLVVEDGDGLRVVADVVVGEPELDAQAGVGRRVERAARVRPLVGLDDFERLVVAAEGFERDREEAAGAGQHRGVAAGRADELAEADFGRARQPAVEQPAGLFEFAPEVGGRDDVAARRDAARVTEADDRRPRVVRRRTDSGRRFAFMGARIHAA
jgi:hypothetical protein